MASIYYTLRIPKRTKVRRPRKRPKSFKTEEKAIAYAKANNIEKFTIKKLNKNKFCICPE